MEPELGCCNRRIVRPRVDLPQPDSPTRPRVCPARTVRLTPSTAVLDTDFAGQEQLRQRLVNRMHKYGNDDDYADGIMVRAFEMLFAEVDGRPNGKGGCYRIEMLPTTAHVYFGSVTGAGPDGRRAGLPLSEGISPVQGADRKGPTAVLPTEVRRAEGC